MGFVANVLIKRHMNHYTTVDSKGTMVLMAK